MTKFLIEGSNGKWYDMYLDDWWVHRDLITAEITGQSFMVWDPWYNRFLRWAFGGNFKRLKLYDVNSKGISAKAQDR